MDYFHSCTCTQKLRDTGWMIFMSASSYVSVSKRVFFCFKRIRAGLSYAPVFNVWIEIGVELPDTVIGGLFEEAWL
jgi:hypothetical protein